MGFLLESFLPVAGAIGFAGCLFYLFKAFEVVKPYEKGIDLKEEEKKIIDELIQMDVLLDNASNQQSPVGDSLKAAPEE